MTIEIHELQRVAFTEEAAGEFATDVTDSATYLDMPIQGIATVVLKEEALDPNVQQQRIDARNGTILGPRSAEMTFTIPLGGTGVPAGDGASSPAHTSQGLLNFLKVLYGGANDANTGTTVTSATTAYTINPPSSTFFDGGEALGWIDSNGNLEARTITEGSGSDLNLRDALSATPSASDVLFAATTIHPTSNPLTSMQFIVEGAEEDDRWLLKGGQVTTAPQLSLALGQIPTLTFTMMFADWSSEPSAAITPADLLTYTPVFGWHSFRAINGSAQGGAVGQCVDASALSLSMNSPVYAPVRSGCGVNTIKRFRRTRAVPFLTLEATIPFEDTSWFTERSDREYYGLFIQIGNVAGQTILIDIPNAQVDDVQRVDAEGLAYQTVTFSATTDEFVTQANDEDIQFAALRLHFL